MYTVLLLATAWTLSVLWTLDNADLERCMSVAAAILCVFGIAAIAILGWPQNRAVGSIQPNLFATPLLAAFIFSQFRPGVLGIGEIGLNKNSRNELKGLELHVDLAARHGQLILVHTPHLEDKLKGTRLILDVLKNDPRIEPGRVLIDHVEEHTVKSVLDRGHWAGMTLYPISKCTPARAVDILDVYGSDRLWMNSACGWGESVTLAIPRTALEMRRRGWSAEAVDRVVYQNPVRFLRQSPHFTLTA